MIIKKAIIVLYLLPLTSIASSHITNVADFFDQLKLLLVPILSLLLGVAVLFYISGAIRFILSGQGDAKQREEAKKTLLFGLIGLFAIVAVWGLVNVLINTFLPGANPPINVSDIPTY